MRWLAALRLASVILVIATVVVAVLALRMMSDMRRWSTAASNGIMSYSLAERTLQVDLLTARAGLLRNYDPVNADMVDADESLSALEQLPMEDPARQVLRDIIAAADRQERMVERFKSHNALLQNSLNRFTTDGSAQIGDHNILSAWILKLTLDTSTSTVTEARAALEDLPRIAATGPEGQLVSHARLLVRILPEIDQLLQSIRGMRIEERVDRLQNLLRAEAGVRGDQVRHLQVSFGVLLAMLAATLTALVLVHRQRTRDLEAQAENERLSAAIAMPLIDTGGATFAARVQSAVDRLASHLGAKRLRLTIPGVPNPEHFSAGDADEDQEWFCRLVQAADANDAWVADRVIASTRGRGGECALNRTMRAAGIKDLVLLRTPEPYQVIIGFEPDGAASAQRSDHMAGIASAIVAIAHGARREVLQLERERLERTIARAGRMETIGAMASGVAHNFNNIIGAIGGFAEMGQERTRKHSPAHRHFEEILSAVERARDLVDEILTFAKQGRTSKRPTDLLAVLRETVQLLSASSRRDAFQLTSSGDRLCVMGAGSELQQVLLNICNNAGHVSGNDPVTIVTGRGTLKTPRRFSHATLAPGNYVTVSIRDHGPGIPDAAWSRLFEPFFTMKLGGTGLGLSTAWEIVEDHGGTIDVENLAPGARFTMWLPEIAEGDGFGIPGDGARILLLGQPGERQAEEELLAELGYEPCSVSLCASAVTLSAALAACDAALIASRDPEAVLKVADTLANITASLPLLLATPLGRSLRTAIVAARLNYPLQRRELAELLPAALVESEPAGAT